MKRSIAAAVAGAATVALTAAAVQGTAAAAAPPTSNASLSSSVFVGTTAVGLTADGRLVGFSVYLPQLTLPIGKVSGLSGDARLVGIDYRVQNNTLYGVGSSGGVYTLSTSSAKATKVSQLTVPLAGSSFGVDFNPAADRLRVISDTGQNLRHDVNPGGATIADGTLTIPPATTPAAGVTASAYTNNDLDPGTATTLFGIDTTLDQVALQSPANSGQLAGTGKLGVDAGTNAGFDIFSDLSKGKTQSVTGWATLSVGGGYRLYSISLLTGSAQSKGAFPKSAQVTDLAVVLDR